MSRTPGRYNQHCRNARILAMLPATSLEVAAEFGITSHLAMSALQHMKEQGRCHLTDKTVPAQAGARGFAPRIWERCDG